MINKYKYQAVHNINHVLGSLHLPGSWYQDGVQDDYHLVFHELGPNELARSVDIITLEDTQADARGAAWREWP